MQRQGEDGAGMADYDTIVIGSGFGAACAALDLVGRGQRLLMLERGTSVARGPQAWLPDASAELTAHFWGDVARRSDGSPVGAHACVGGPSVFFGGVAMRMRPDDFVGSAEVVAGSGARWPLRYEELEGSYARAERLFDVAGTAGCDPTEPPRSTPYPQDTPALSDVTRRIENAGRRMGLRPFPLPLAINHRPDGRLPGCVRCATCDTFACAIGAKNDVPTRLLEPLVRRGVELRDATQVTRLVVEGRSIVAVLDTVAARRTSVQAGVLQPLRHRRRRPRVEEGVGLRRHCLRDPGGVARRRRATDVCVSPASCT